MKKHFEFFLLFLLFCLTLFLRVYRLADFPAGLNADEAAIGYNAYSLLQTGKDEFGHAWPINFQSFNDYKPGLYFYLVLPFVKVLGLNEWAVRLPSTILGSLTVLIIYCLTKKWFDSRVALVASALLAISPWHLHFSRGGWETNAATFFIVLGIYFFSKALTKPLYFVLCTLFFALSMFTYHSARLVVPLLGVGLLTFNWKEVFTKKNWPSLAGSSLTGVILAVPLLFSFMSEAGVSRFSGVGLFADQGPFWKVNELRGQHTDPQSLFPKLVHNQYFEYGLHFLENWTSHFGANFLFVSGDEIERNRIPQMGQMYLIELPFLLLGFYFLLKNNAKASQSILWWLAVAPVASAMTFQSPHAIRALNLVIPLTIICAYGIVNFVSQIKNKFLVSLFYCFLAVALLGNFSFYLYQYYVQYPRIYPAAWEHGFRELGDYLVQNESRFEKIYITSKYDQPYILTAFYLKYPPETFQEQAKLTPRDNFGFSTVAHFGKYHFGPIDWETLKDQKSVLIIGSFEEVPDSATIAKRIYFKDGKTEAFRIVEN
ncbi:MAG: ArnT family glycosyltransferase [Patescibacteria group bacterium]|jgi:4-amino-4-deoxy-L-arabinose transferase-like glycosyltransferase